MGMGAGGNGNRNNQWEWEGNGNRTRQNLGLGMGMNGWEWEGMGLKKIFPLISAVYCEWRQMTIQSVKAHSHRGRLRVEHIFFRFVFHQRTQTVRLHRELGSVHRTSGTVRKTNDRQETADSSDH